jgi:hypothetical protein
MSVMLAQAHSPCLPVLAPIPQNQYETQNQTQIKTEIKLEAKN